MVYSKKKINLMRGGWSKKDIGFAVTMWIMMTAGTVVWAVLSFTPDDPIDILEAEKEANRAAGRGYITDAQVETEKAANFAAGRGNLTNTEVETAKDALVRGGAYV
jgi:hypothetical protein